MQSTSYESFKAEFPYVDDKLYELVFQRNQSLVKTKRPAVAVVNLKRIIEQTFAISASTGFHEMSLRQLSSESGISIGGIYACISSKEDISQMVCDTVCHVQGERLGRLETEAKALPALHRYVRESLFAIDLMQPWFYFLYHEVRGLTDEQMQAYKKFEIRQRSMLLKLIQRIRGEDAVLLSGQSGFIVTMLVLFFHEWHLHRERYRRNNISVESYADEVTMLLDKSLCEVAERTPATSEA